MRDILFKAKRIDNGEWVEGHYYSQVYHEGTIEEEWYHFIKPIGSESWERIRVKPETICQFTGLTDKNGQKIWENDILDCKDRVTVVKWHTPCGTWDSVFVRYKGELCSNGIQVVEWKYRAEVIGNIFDDQELLKGGGAE